MTSVTSIETIKDKFKRGKYSLNYAPRILYMDCSDVYINKNGEYPNEIESLENFDWEKDEIKTQKLCADSYGDWSFEISMISTNYFDSREQLDDLYLDKNDREVSDSYEYYDWISFKQALNVFRTKLWSNMNYYLNNLNELEKDLHRKLNDSEINSEKSINRLQEEILYKQLIKLFGRYEDINDNFDDDFYNKTFVLNEFRVLSWDRNTMYATARRGSYYLLFLYDTS